MVTLVDQMERLPTPFFGEARRSRADSHGGSVRPAQDGKLLLKGHDALTQICRVLEATSLVGRGARVRRKPRVNETERMADPYAFSVEASIDIAAAPEIVFDRLCDITRLGELSPECTGGEWLTEDSARVGARFLGHNSSRGRTWTTECEVLAADRPRTFAWHVLTNTTPGTSIWSFRIDPNRRGSRVTESFEMRTTPFPFRSALDSAAPERRSSLLEMRKRELEDGIRATLAALKDHLEGIA